MYPNLAYLSLQYYTQAHQMSAVEWLYPGGHLDFSATILYSNNESVDTWNAIAQGMKLSEETDAGNFIPGTVLTQGIGPKKP